FWQELRSIFQGDGDGLLIQDYLTGVGGGDVTPAMIDDVLADLEARTEAERPVWMGMGSPAGAG
ncbi:MAG: hypothetical protein JSV95_10325, partial [Gemmatimonadota bacterium]